MYAWIIQIKYNESSQYVSLAVKVGDATESKEEKWVFIELNNIMWWYHKSTLAVHTQHNVEDRTGSHAWS